MRKFIFITLFATFALNGNPANAAITPLSVGIVPPVQFPKDDFSITGLRLSVLWGRHRDLYGLDFGALGNITEQDFVGSSFSGVFNATHGPTRVIGVQFAGAANINTNKTSIYGTQLTLGINSNTAAATIAGLQFALLANLSPNTVVYGAQLGLYNQAQEVYGIQIGLVNFTKSLHGIQIGLLNINTTGLFALSPLLNIGF